MPCLPSPKFHHHFYRWYGNPIPSRGWFMTLFYPHWISIVFSKDFRKAPDSGWKMAQAPLHFLPPWAWPDGEDTMHLMAKTPEKVSCREPSSFLWENANISQTYLKLPTSTNIYQPGRDFFTSKSLKFGNRYCTLRTCCLIHQSWRSPKIRQVKPLTFGLQSFFSGETQLFQMYLHVSPGQPIFCALRTLFSLACCSDIQEKNFVLPLQSWKPLEAFPISAKLKQQTWNVEHQ